MDDSVTGEPGEASGRLAILRRFRLTVGNLLVEVLVGRFIQSACLIELRLGFVFLAKRAVKPSQPPMHVDVVQASSFSACFNSRSASSFCPASPRMIPRSEMGQ